jgi:hypothetical protein
MTMPRFSPLAGRGVDAAQSVVFREEREWNLKRSRGTGSMFLRTPLFSLEGGREIRRHVFSLPWFPGSRKPCIQVLFLSLEEILCGP